MAMSTTDTEVIDAFATGSVFSTSDEELRRFLNVLCQTQYSSDLVRHRALIYGNHDWSTNNEELSATAKSPKLHPYRPRYCSSFGEHLRADIRRIPSLMRTDDSLNDAL
jgi:2C-methyl-D-erythritol 2,4-cyclodiphosphate synthase